MNRNLVNLIQAAVVVTVCALVGLALSRVPGDETVPAWVPTGIGALIGLTAIGLGTIFGRKSAPIERKMEMDPHA
jgi:integral membrane sensor domain MASE1